MGFFRLINKETIEDVDRVRIEKEEEARLEINPSGKYIVLRNGAFDWSVVIESKKGLTFKDAQTVYEYEVKFGRTDPRNLMIVKVED